MATSNMEELCRIAHRKGLTIELPYSAGKGRLSILVSLSNGGQFIEQESVKEGEVVDEAARRVVNRLRKSGIS